MSERCAYGMIECQLDESEGRDAVDTIQYNLFARDPVFDRIPVDELILLHRDVEVVVRTPLERQNSHSPTTSGIDDDDEAVQTSGVVCNPEFPIIDPNMAERSLPRSLFNNVVHIQGVADDNPVLDFTEFEWYVFTSMINELPVLTLGHTKDMNLGYLVPTLAKTFTHSNISKFQHRKAPVYPVSVIFTRDVAYSYKLTKMANDLLDGMVLAGGTQVRAAFVKNQFKKEDYKPQFHVLVGHPKAIKQYFQCYKIEGGLNDLQFVVIEEGDYLVKSQDYRNCVMDFFDFLRQNADDNFPLTSVFSQVYKDDPKDDFELMKKIINPNVEPRIIIAPSTIFAPPVKVTLCTEYEDFAVFNSRLKLLRQILTHTKKDHDRNRHKPSGKVRTIILVRKPATVRMLTVYCMTHGFSIAYVNKDTPITHVETQKAKWRAGRVIAMIADYHYIDELDKTHIDMCLVLELPTKMRDLRETLSMVNATAETHRNSLAKFTMIFFHVYNDRLLVNSLLTALHEINAIIPEELIKISKYIQDDSKNMPVSLGEYYNNAP